MTSMLSGKLQTQRGFMLLDALLGLAIVGVFVTTLLSSISTGFIGLRTSEEVAIAESLVRSQLESLKSQTYLSVGGYSLVSAPSGYTTAVAVESISGVDPSAMQQVAVTVFHNSKVIRVIKNFKVNR